MDTKEAKKRDNSVWTIFDIRNLYNPSFWKRNNSIFLSSRGSLKGFTLIELVIVVGIAAALITAYLLFGNPALQTAKAKDSKRMSDIQQLKAALDLYYNDHNCYPDAIPSDSWVENGTVYMLKVPKDPGTGLGYLYQVDSTDSCPQWNVLYTKYAGRSFQVDDCSLASKSACNYTGTAACAVSGTVDCSYISNHPVSTADEETFCSPKLYVKSQAGDCNVAPEGAGTYCKPDCSE